MFFVSMQINENTKISKLISAHEGALEAIVSINRHFEKLRVPVLRKALASRVSIKQAAKIGGVTVDDFYKKLIPLGFEVSGQSTSDPDSKNPEHDNFESTTIIDFDVRDWLKQDKDPFDTILNVLKKMQVGHTLNVINSFEPVPLIKILQSKGFQCKVIHSNDLCFTHILKSSTVKENFLKEINREEEEAVSPKFYLDQPMVKLDVRHLEMPMPMQAVLSALNDLPPNKTLHVIHKRVPQFLLPQLTEMDFRYSIHELPNGGVDIYIYK